MSEIKIGDLIKESRIKSGYKTMKDFSIVTGVSPAALSRIEKNTQDPTPETLMKISRHLNNITYGELMKAAGYLYGLSPEHEQFLTEQFNENSEMDNKITELIDSVLMYKQADDNVVHTVTSLFVNSDISELYVNPTNDEIKNAYYQCDFSIEEKKEVAEKLSDLINKFSPKLANYFANQKNMKPIPLIGTICAGNGIIPNEEIEDFISYPFLGKEQPDYALRVKGESMTGAGINPNDIVFLRKRNWAEYNGQIVAVIVNNEDASLKRMSWSEGSPMITLSPENNSYQSVEVTPNEIVVCGVYAGHFKQEF
ncbi:helix-turn-helix domain-containing protein [Paenibacillus hubeiensis]|uniref:helix-turn-helix domain-containing protein n=1 Tax=Paenibacillus hubeiensis TaxID=3077330 RepID=UPI0031BBA878